MRLKLQLFALGVTVLVTKLAFQDFARPQEQGIVATLAVTCYLLVFIGSALIVDHRQFHGRAGQATSDRLG